MHENSKKVLFKCSSETNTWEFLNMYKIQNSKKEKTCCITELLTQSNVKREREYRFCHCENMVYMYCKKHTLALLFKTQEATWDFGVQHIALILTNQYQGFQQRYNSFWFYPYTPMSVSTIYMYSVISRVLQKTHRHYQEGIPTHDLRAMSYQLELQRSQV